MSPALAGEFFATSAIWQAVEMSILLGFSGGGLGSRVLCLMTPTLAVILLGSHKEEAEKQVISLRLLPGTHLPTQAGSFFCCCCCCFIFFYFLAIPHGMWELNSLTRDGTLTPCIGSSVC